MSDHQQSLLLVLASQSASRMAMLEAAGIGFEAIPADLDERKLEESLGGVGPAQVAGALAEAKALAVSKAMPGRMVLGSDSLVDVAGRRFDKPASRADAAAHLRFFSGKAMALHSSAALAKDGSTLWQGHDVATLHFIDLSDAFIETYLEHEWPAVSGCVGVFRIEGRGVQLFERIDGDQFTVMGMPLLQVLGGFRELGVQTS